MTTLPTTGPTTGPPPARSGPARACDPPAAPAARLRMTPGRWLALAIGVPVALALIGWTGFSLVTTLGQASFPVNTAIPVQTVASRPARRRRHRRASGPRRRPPGATDRHRPLQPDPPGLCGARAGDLNLHCRIPPGTAG